MKESLPNPFDIGHQIQLPHLDLIQRRKEEHEKYHPYTSYMLGKLVKVSEMPEYVKPVITMHKEQGIYREIDLGGELFCYQERYDRIEEGLEEGQR